MDRIAKSLDTLRRQVNEKFPGRSKDSDGWIGNAEHQARTSDHNPWIKDGHDWVVSALDITNDPAHGLVSNDFAEMLIANRDPRIKYVISNRRIASGKGGPQPWVWRKYTGPNPHDHHYHISVLSDKGLYDDAREWDIGGLVHRAPDPKYVPPRPTLRQGARGEDVKFLQTKLGLRADGIFGTLTRIAVVALQNKRNLVADGIVGPQTWEVIFE